MTGTVQWVSQTTWNAPRAGWWELLRAELTMTPERTARMARMTLLVMLVVLVSMTLRVPEAAVSAYMIFFIARDDAPDTIRSGIGLVVAVTGAVLVGLVVLSLTVGEPVLRLGGMAALSLVAMYAQRRSPKLGVLGYAVGVVASIFLVYAGHFPTPEVTVRAVLWIWVAIAYPAALLVLCEGTFGADPEVLLRKGIALRLTAVGSLLGATSEDGERAQRRVDRLERLGAGVLVPFAALGPVALRPLRVSLVRETQSLLMAARQLSPLVASSTSSGPLRRAGATCLGLARELLDGKAGGAELPPWPAQGELHGQLGDADPEVVGAGLSLIGSVWTLSLGMTQLREAAQVAPASPAPEPPPSTAELESLRAEALHFASKVTLAAMASYILFTALDWWGIHTAIITCWFIAQESVGATIHKSALRLVGAIIGGALGIASLVFVLPRLDSGGELALLVGAVTLFATWFATGSQRISYAGWQIAFAFFLTVLQGFERTTKMVVARDRVLGVLLGNGLMSIVFLHLWPVRLAPRISQGIGWALDSLAELLLFEGTGPEAEAHSAQLQLSFVAGLNKAEEVAFFARFEPGGVDSARVLPALSGLLIPARALSLSVTAAGQAAAALPETERWRVEALAALRDALARHVSELAAEVREGKTLTLRMGREAVEGARRSFAAVTEPALRELETPLRLRLKWLEAIHDRLEEIVDGSDRMALVRESP
jgi:multidrug resistance protein MdtO